MGICNGVCDCEVDLDNYEKTYDKTVDVSVKYEETLTKETDNIFFDEETMN